MAPGWPRWRVGPVPQAKPLRPVVRASAGSWWATVWPLWQAAPGRWQATAPPAWRAVAAKRLAAWQAQAKRRAVRESSGRRQATVRVAWPVGQAARQI